MVFYLGGECLMIRFLNYLQQKGAKVPCVYVCGRTIISIFIFNIILICIVLSFTILLRNSAEDFEAVPVMGGLGGQVDNQKMVERKSMFNSFHNESEFYRAILNESIPLLCSKDRVYRGAFGTTSDILNNTVYCMMNVQLTKPHTFLKSEMPIMTAADVEFDVIKHKLPREIRKEMEQSSRSHEVSLWDRLKNAAKERGLSEKKLPKRELPKGKPLVGIYHTHNSECYVPTSAMTHAAGQNGDVYKVGETLKNALEKKGIETVHSGEIHDYPEFMKAYGKSIYTVKEMVNKYPSLEMLIDLHRDSLSKDTATVKLKGEDFAKVAIVIGTDKLGLEHPNWKKNYAFAEQIVAKMEVLYPGLSRGIIIGKGRYNQHFFEHTLIFEVGGHENKIEEAERSADALANIIEAVLQEIPES